MDRLIEFFTSLDHRPMLRVGLIAIPVFLLWILENGFPLIRLRYRRSKWAHAGVNFLFTIIHFIIHGSLAVLLVVVSDWCQLHQFGVVHWLELPVGLTVIAGVLSMDFFGGWLVHRIEHGVPLFWRIHIVHHADNNVDVTTGLRHHPLEALNRWVFFTLGVFIMGLPIYAVLIGQTFMSIFTMFTHANIRLPERMDKIISYVFVSPNMHKVHHHYRQPFTDSNYGTALSIWDRMVGTFRYLAPGEIVYGLDRYYDNDKDESVGDLMKSPFDNWDAAEVHPPVDHVDRASTSPVK